MGENDYRAGAQERLEEALVLLRSERFGGSIYLAGRAVEGILRAVVWKSDPDYALGRKSLETGHDVRKLLNLASQLGVMARTGARDDVFNNVQPVARLWTNDMRYLPQRRIAGIWRTVNEIGGKRTLKRAAQEYYNACSIIIRKCEALWRS